MFIITIIIFFLVLSLLVLVHEAGHFWTARRFGIKVDEFGLGLPPRVFGFKKVNGKWKYVGAKENSPETFDHTVYSLNWIPVGGFVKIKGENGEEADSADSFGSKAIWKRCVILVAGVTMNVVLCVFLLSLGFGLGMPTAIDSTSHFDYGAIVSQSSVKVMEVIKDMPAATAGIQQGDTLLSVGDQKVSSIEGLQQYLADKNNQQLKLTWEHNNKVLTAEVTIKENNGKPGIGVALAELSTVRYPWYLAVWEGIKATYFWFISIVVAFAMIIKNLFIGKPAGVDVAGPVGIAVMTGQAAKLGFVYLLQFMALLSLNLAIINILPFPALDGGRVLFLVIEKIRGKAIKQKWENLAHNIGFILLMVLVVLVTFKDVGPYVVKLWQGIMGLFGK